MRFESIGFTHSATGKLANEDRVLVHDRVLREGQHRHPPVDTCFAFVADGIGGSRSAATASQFVLDALNVRLPTSGLQVPEELAELLHSINQELISQTGLNPETRGSATTLVGAVFWAAGFHVINAGDSEAWISREGRFFRVSEPQVLNPGQTGSPVTSYFGGTHSALDPALDGTLREVRPGDVLLFCSDGLRRAVPADQIAALLRTAGTLSDKMAFLNEQVAAAHRPDDASCVAVGVHCD